MKNGILTSTFEQLQQRLYLKARAMLASDDDARDVLQDAFFKLWANHAVTEHERNAAGLLMTTVRNLSIDRLRRRQTRPEIPIDDRCLPDCEEDHTSDERHEVYLRVERLVRLNLSPRDREILFRRDRDGWSFDEIAAEYGVTEANARLIVARARKTIRTLFNSNNE